MLLKRCSLQFVFLPYRIYSALNALGLYNKNAKILFLVRMMCHAYV